MTDQNKQSTFAELLEKYGFEDLEKVKIEKENDEDDVRKNIKITEPLNIQAEIDLHSQSRMEALDNAENFIEHCHKNNLTKILIITGKGSGVLNQTIKNLLDEMTQSGIINKYKNAPARLGGQGAFVVVLN